ncbi:MULTISPECIES: hypothetical protein [Bradyrhizobium]|jgi:hypothetical protein|uniref:Uncharacterized protein n=1 Tax=Bradyrhizobium diazoefficiens TaxID=1355477 RepID=A0A809XE02_9BRAD|nr:MULTISPECIES: hypothetical protein [Bradyrhizobium]MBP1062475.1 hypothetical protein [Bradyrhizobium japonicum]MBP1095489.1 hypothetical protein [Bradyrhizobium japonicum]MCD9291507.1 hypothetical protein [Bradyrhizobium diazoefficiens]MCD9809589.1 hypothetical protein [Bradyrhizobium diazoefficiens]MCD9827963.1 hypothetical protein [Bradyrhizobium diazoefficiens]
MILLRDFALYVLPALVAGGGWLYALCLRKRARSGRAPERRYVPPASLAP